ncbi:MAG: hypothetical protein HY542_03680 [Deltaproteobacteria bacterium]|nr:hypothetical protein [Deltaproteobacteria bacterium]
MQFATPSQPKDFDPYLEIPCDQFKILGRSLGGIETVMTIPQWNITFDTGRAPDFAFPMDFLALSHWHLDHAGGLPFYLGLRRLNSLPPLKIITMPEKIAATEKFLEGLRNVSETTIECEILSSAEPIPIKNDLTLKSIPSFHCAPSTGYLVVRRRNQLKPEFRGKSELEIAEANRRGVKVSEETRIPLLAYSGDTKWEFLETTAAKAKYLLMECSFFGDASEYDGVRKYGHTHILDWKKHAESIRSESVVMIHTSRRYSKKEIEKACQANLPKDLLDRLIIFR